MFHRTFSFVAAGLLVCGVANATPIKQSAGAVQQVLAVSDDDANGSAVIASQGWTDISGARLQINIPAGSNQLLVARFTAAVVVTGNGNPASYGLLRIVMGTREFLPVVSYSVADNVVGKVPTAALQRSIVAAPGLHTVNVQFTCWCDSLVNFRVSKWHLTLEAAPVQ